MIAKNPNAKIGEKLAVPFTRLCDRQEPNLDFPGLTFQPNRLNYKLLPRYF